MTLLIKNITYLVTCDDDNRVLKEVNVLSKMESSNPSEPTSRQRMM